MQYCGPGPFTIQVSDDVNQICKEHDYNYGLIIKEFGYAAAYIKFNWADQLMIDQMKELKLSYREKLILQYFENKRLYGKSFL